MIRVEDGSESTSPPSRRLEQVASLLWLAAVAVSMALGAWRILPLLIPRHRVTFSATASTDAILGGAQPGLTAAKLRGAIAEVAPGDAILFAGVHQDPRFFQSLYATSLLALPRQVPAVACPADGGAGHVAVPFDKDRRITAVLYFGVPPALPDSIELATGVHWLRVPPIPATSLWTSVCRVSPSP